MSLNLGPWGHKLGDKLKTLVGSLEATFPSQLT